jgi:hypothetical protein
MDNNIEVRQYLKKGKGKLVSQNHGVTAFVKTRRQQILLEQLAREKNPKTNLNVNVI